MQEYAYTVACGTDHLDAIERRLQAGQKCLNYPHVDSLNRNILVSRQFRAQQRRLALFHGNVNAPHDRNRSTYRPGITTTTRHHPRFPGSIYAPPLQQCGRILVRAFRGSIPSLPSLHQNLDIQVLHIGRLYVFPPQPYHILTHTITRSLHHRLRTPMFPHLSFPLTHPQAGFVVYVALESYIISSKGGTHQWNITERDLATQLRVLVPFLP